MPSKPKEKHTKEQILLLLDRAIEKEEALSEKISTLETELLNCRKKAENPRYELDELAVPANKVSFRIDYYRTAPNIPLKGIIEHLPTRDTHSFNGEGFETISAFIKQFLPQYFDKVNLSKNEVPLVLQARGTPVDLLMPSALTKAHAAGLRVIPELLRAGEGFQVEISTSGLEGSPKQGFMATLMVEELDGDIELVYKENCPSLHDVLRFPSKAVVLHAGAYRLTALLKSLEDANNTYFRESRLIVVP